VGKEGYLSHRRTYRLSNGVPDGTRSESVGKGANAEKITVVDMVVSGI
jgi:hypothetical protein